MVFPRAENSTLTGTASVPLLVWIKKRMRASVDTSALLFPCAGEFATCAQAGVKVTTATHAVRIDSTWRLEQQFKFLDALFL